MAQTPGVEFFAVRNAAEEGWSASAVGLPLRLPLEADETAETRVLDELMCGERLTLAQLWGRTLLAVPDIVRALHVLTNLGIVQALRYGRYQVGSGR